ncbi:hypothetical protein DPMN_144406 [Dreissena polymorpha]|uniref:S-formylglutathione hydrolase n=1 Tax=Dreissena polymorpha TaxID=45954 RepID=A0A9D4JQ60_DREPO|nr:hypothetical protein DPMN_144406 [Dreissena polymorpha]
MWKDNSCLTICQLNVRPTMCPINLRIHEGYDHSYYFIATFIEEHINHHAKFLLQ